MTGLQLEIKELSPYKAGTTIQQEIGFDLSVSTYRIMQLRRKLKENIVEIGLELIKAKGNLDHGDWEDWVRNDLGWNPSTAWRFMNAAQKCNGDLAQAQDLDLEDFWGHKPKIPNLHSIEGEPRSLQDIERALAISAQQLKGYTDKVLRDWRNILTYAEKLEWCIEYYAHLDIDDIYLLLEKLTVIMKTITEISTDFKQKLEDIKVPDEIHIYTSGDFEKKGIEQIKKESAVPFGD